MKIEHIAIWSNNIERLKKFYEKYFHAVSSKKYINEAKQFQSYFLSFDSGCRLELMQTPSIKANENCEVPLSGMAHFAVSVGSNKNVDRITNILRNGGCKILREPRYTGDGYYESVVIDPDGNKIEITA